MTSNIIQPNYSEGNQRFDQEAKDWDSKPETVQSSLSCYQSLLKLIPALTNGEAKQWSALEIGAGTGLLSVKLINHLKSLVGVDTSQGMIDVLQSKADKLRENGIEGLKGVKVLLEDPNDPAIGGQKFDLAISHLVFHHIPDMARTISVMRDCLLPGGQIIISDFEDTGPHSLLFHPKKAHTGVERHGLKRDEMKHLLESAGFQDVKVEVEYELLKTVESQEEGEGNERKENFPFLICRGFKASQ